MKVNGFTYRIPLYPALMLLFIAVCSAVLNYFTPLTGDDLNKWFAAGGALDVYPNEQTRRFIGGSYVGSVGRLFDILGAVTLARTPRLLTALLLALGNALYFFAILFAASSFFSFSSFPSSSFSFSSFSSFPSSSFPSPSPSSSSSFAGSGRQHCAVDARRQSQSSGAAFSALLLAAAILVTPWWDSLWLRCCQLSYLIGVAFTLLFIPLFFGEAKAEAQKSSIWKTILLALLAFLASSAHEQNAIALCFAVIVIFLLNRARAKLTFNQRVMIIALGLGAAFSVCAPSTLRRLNEFSQPQVGAVEILLTTVPLMTLLTLAAVLLLIPKKSRRFIANELRTPTGAFFLTGLVSALIAIKIGIPGRTGVLAEACALIVIARSVHLIRRHINNIMATLLTILATLFIAAHYLIAIPCQIRAYDEITSAVEQYKNSDSGLIFADYTPRENNPAIILNRVKSLADNDDRHLGAVYSHVLKGDSIPFVVLPTAFREPFENGVDSLTINNITITTTRPAGIILMQTLDGYPLEVISRSGETLLVTTLPSSSLPLSTLHSSSHHSSTHPLYILEPLHLDPGDGLHPF